MIITETPFRISFAGGGTDLPDYYQRGRGAVLAAAIDKYFHVTVKRRFDRDIYVNYSRVEIVRTVAEIEHDLVREALKLVGITEGIQISMLSDIPAAGSGLGSSSSLLVGLLNALYLYQGRQVDARRLAEDACFLEIDQLGRPIGKQDQWMAALGGLQLLQFRADDRVVATPLDLTDDEWQDLSSRLMLFYTGVTRAAATILTEQQARIGQELERLGRMRDEAEALEGAIRARDFDAIGRTMHVGWLKKRELAAGITNPMLDALYARARITGEIGGKIAGAGGGGFLLLYCPLKYQAEVRAELADLQELHFRLARMGSRCIFNNGL